MKPMTDGQPEFAVDGKKIPEVKFDVGESYAGLLPISSTPGETRQLYFWYFPTTNPAGQDDITIWLNGGPGCSSLEGILQENGPFLWQYGTFQPVRNPYTWVNLTNMIWVEQPVGTGYSQGVPSATSEEDVAAQFLGFFKNFLDTFELHNKRIYITGESYAGYYVPYIADAMFNAKDLKYFDVKGTMIYDPSLSSDVIQQDIPALAFQQANANVFGLNASFTAALTDKANKCRFTNYLDTQLSFPPKGPLADPPPNNGDCAIFKALYDAAALINPCFNVYHITTTCPILWDVLGYPGSFSYLPQDAAVYFDRSDVKQAINAPEVLWQECSKRDVFRGGIDKSQPSSYDVLPRVIERSNRTIIAHGALDMILMGNGTLLAIQNMTWGGKQGFQSAPSQDFIVPSHQNSDPATLAGAGVFGTTHTERGLTWIDMKLTGHMVPQYAPSAAYRQLEYLLGRVDTLTKDLPFTTQPRPKAPVPSSQTS
ncbi:MAG: hypothetical protein M1817_002352 [Caeruleum heppii]|nr:MAG: hypothetical protein M1817_003463 [Caeruleum heppii]KAI9673714.1 MAG: hypothetical protein M1817_002352 [Caeruleum heppii]